MLATLLFLACAGGDTSASAATAPKAAATPTASVAAKPAAPAQAAPVGPDGPPDIAIAAIDAVPTDAASIAEGEKVFAAKGCGGCHAWGSKLVGPDLTGLSDRRSTAWIQRMIVDPDTMTKKDPVARELFKTHMVQMPKQGVSDAEMPKLLAFIDAKGK